MAWNENESHKRMFRYAAQAALIFICVGSTVVIAVLISIGDLVRDWLMFTP